ncbi:MAG: hypothetical protein HC848_07140 [Limnobacter sp.]|nr:hypothetical protein [Limnobacter sp.]
MPSREGSLQLEMQTAARRNGFLPVQVPAGFEGVLAGLNSGKPVLVFIKPVARDFPHVALRRSDWL